MKKMELFANAQGLAHYLPGQNAFTAVLPRSTATSTKAPPKKRGPRPQALRVAITMESTEERVARLNASRLAKATAYSKTSAASFTLTPHPSRPIHRATGAMRTSA